MDDPRLALEELVNAQTWIASKAVMAARSQALFAPETEAIFKQLIEQYAEDPAGRNSFERVNDLLARARTEGIEAAYADLLTPDYAELLAQELFTLPHSEARRVDVARALLALTDPGDRKARAAFQYELGSSLLLGPGGDDSANIEESIGLLQEALKVQTRQASPEGWASIQNSLSIAYRKRVIGDRSANFERALRYAKNLLTVVRRETVPSGWPLAMNTLGNVYTIRIRGRREVNLAKAVACFRQGLEGATGEGNAGLAAMIRYNLGFAILEKKRVELEEVEEAIRHFQEAAQFYLGAGLHSEWSVIQANLDRALELSKFLALRREAPAEWARLQHNLGERHRTSGEGDAAEDIEQAIAHFKQALEVFTPEAYPADCGLTENSLGAAYVARERGDKAGNIERAIQHLRRALALRPREKFPAYWAKTQANLGSAYMLRIKGDPVKNLEKSIRHLEASLSEKALPLALQVQGEIQVAGLWRERKRGDRRLNLKQAIRHAESALTLLSSERSRSEYEAAQRTLAQAQWNLAMLYHYSKEGNPEENQENALRYYEAALAGYGRIDTPRTVVATIHYLTSSVYYKRRLGDPAENQQKAIERLHRALGIFPSDGPANLRSSIHETLGYALLDRAGGDRDENFEAAIPHYRAALENLSTEEQPEHAASLRSALGVILLETLGGNRAENLEEARRCQLAALEVWTREDHPEWWARTLHNLGNVYSERILGSRAENMEEAIRCFETALKVFTRGEHPQDWAMTQNSLGGAYQLRLRGDRADNLENTIQHLSRALAIYTRETFPQDWAMAMHNLGNAYRERIRERRADNLEMAIHCYQASLEFRTREALPFYWAMTHVDLGNAYLERKLGERAANITQAIGHFRLALEVYTREAFSMAWAGAQLSLGQAHAANARQRNAAENLAAAIGCYEAALSVYTRESHPERWAIAQSYMGLAYHRRAANGKPEDRKTAIEHLQRALEVFTAETDPASCRKLLARLGNEHMLAHDWRAASEVYERAIWVAETVLSETYTEVGRQEETGATSALYSHSAYCLLQLQRPEESLVRLEAGKARLLKENLAVDNVDLAGLPPELAERLRESRHAVRELEAELRITSGELVSAGGAAVPRLDEPSADSETGPGYILHRFSLRAARAVLGSFGLDFELRPGLREERQKLREAVEAVRAADPSRIPPVLDASAILTQAPPGGALVTFLLTAEGSVVWVLPHGASRVESAHAMSLGAETYRSLHELLTDETGWLNTYLRWLQGEPLEAWKTKVESAGRRLWDLLMGPVHERLAALGLAEGAPVVLVPQARIGLLPLHAAWREVEGVPRSFLDDYTVTYAPSIYALSISRCQVEEPSRSQPGLFAVANPAGDLPYAELEVGRVERFFAPEERRILRGAEATEDQVVQGMAARSYLHFACHGRYDWRDVARSELTLAGGARLTLAKVISPEVDLTRTRLVVLSACETGLIEFERAPDESLGLPAAFLEGGAPGVVSTLWAVNDVSMALLVEELYRRHREQGQEIAAALRGAQLWLRDGTAAELGLADRWREVYGASDPPDPAAYRLMRYFRANPGLKPFNSPYHWAAPTFTGA
ncbi:MAG TPA: CHAT domain-containing protein [Thermoanaerobaculia bacterium]|jgi:CHAT domain-containing protein/tetratricopeptide (TPR) repeat protein